MRTISSTGCELAKQHVGRSASATSVSGSPAINSVIVALLIFGTILSATVFKPVQVAVELSLIVLLASLLTRHRLSREEVLLLVVFAASQLVSLALNDLNVFMLDAKQFALVILTFLYFRKNHFKTGLIGVAFAINVFLVLFQLWTGKFILNMAPLLAAMQDLIESRPLGLFLNFHLSAYFAAVYLIYFSHFKTMYLLDYMFLYLSGVATGLISYFFQRIASLKLFRSLMLRNRLTVSVIIIAGLSVVYLGADFILSLAEDQWSKKYTSLLVIYRQVLDPMAYLPLLTPYPSDATSYIESTVWDYTDIGFGEIGNEIALFTIFTQGGIVLASSYLFILTKHLTQFRVFFWVSLLHYGYILSPLIIYMMVTYEAEIRKASEI